MQQFINAIKNRAGAMDSQQGADLWGVVVAVEGNPFRVKVQLQPDGQTTGWLSVVTVAAGNGWGLMVVPQNGMQARIEPDSSSGSQWVVTGFIHSDVDVPPSVPNSAGTGGTLNGTNTDPQPGETLLTHASGTVIRMTKAGVVYIRGLVEIDGDLHVNGNVFDWHGSLDRLRGNHNTHGHNYNAGSSPSITGAPAVGIDPE